MDRRVMRTRTAIKNAYLELVREKNTPKISISELSRRANIDRKTFYLHYDSVSDIWDEYIDNLVKMSLEIFDEAEFRDDFFNIEKLYKLIEVPLDSNSEFLKIISDDQAYDMLWHRLEDTLSRKITEIYSTTSKDSDAENRIRVDFFIIGIINIYRRWARGSYDVSLHDLVEIVGSCVHHGTQSK